MCRVGKGAPLRAVPTVSDDINVVGAALRGSR
jgi:hypothetical protein